MGNDRHGILALFALMFSSIAFAGSTSDALTSIEAETMLLKAREKQLEVQANILSKQNEIALKQGFAGTLPQLSSSLNPVLLGVEGLGKALYATLETSGGVFDVQRGDVLSNGMRVISISMNGVTLREASGKNIHLVVNVQKRSTVSEDVAAGAGMLPPLPPFSPSVTRRAVR